jgi:NADP-reducing hydrogenase subunit HndC
MPEIGGRRRLAKLRYHVLACDEAGDFCGCQANGAAELRETLKVEIAKRKLAGAVKLTITNCNQPGASGPVLVIYPDGIWYDGLTLEDIPRFIDEQLIGGRPLEDKLMQQQRVTRQSAY